MRQSIRVLLVEDEAFIALCLEMELKQAGFTVCQRVATGEDAVVSAQQDAPDWILMDIRLAGDLDGIAAAQQIQAAAPIPVVFMTAYPDQAVVERAQHLRPLGFFIKPVNMAALKAIVDAAFPH